MKNNFVLAMFVIFLGIVPTLALIFCCWYCCRDRRQRQQLWAKIQRAPKLSLPYVFLTAVFVKISSALRRLFNTETDSKLKQSTGIQHSVTTALPKVPVEAGTTEMQLPIVMKREELERICSSARIDSLLLSSDDPGEKPTKMKKKGKTRDIHVEVITIETSTKSKLKSFGVASERLITERVEISPVSSAQVRSASSSPKLMRRVDDTKLSMERLKNDNPIRDFGIWVKDQVNLKLPALSFKRSASTTSDQSGPSTTDSALTEPSSPFFPKNSTVPSSPEIQVLVTNVDQINNSPPPPPLSKPQTAIAKPSSAKSLTKPSLPPPPPPPPPPSISFSLV